MVEEPFDFHEPGGLAEDKKVGEGCYVSTTVHNRRYYGVLIDQAALKAASLLYFQDEASALDLNRRMQALKQQDEPTVEVSESRNERKRQPSSKIDAESSKRLRGDIPDGTYSSSLPTAQAPSPLQQVQKFRFVDASTNGGSSAIPGYRLLLATYANVDAAAEDDSARTKEIEAACQSGGNFVGQYYYQYEVSGFASRCG